MNRVRPINVHRLKTCCEPFQAVWEGLKLFEVRRENDRSFCVGDLLDLKEWDDEAGVFTGRGVLAYVTYKVRQCEWGMPAGLCVLGFTSPQIYTERPEQAALQHASSSPVSSNETKEK